MILHKFLSVISSRRRPSPGAALSEIGKAQHKAFVNAKAKELASEIGADWPKPAKLPRNYFQRAALARKEIAESKGWAS